MTDWLHVCIYDMQERERRIGLGVHGWFLGDEDINEQNVHICISRQSLGTLLDDINATCRF